MHPYSIAGVQLEDVIDEVERLAEQSSLPEYPDKDWADAFLIDVTRDNCFMG
jgi:hypothetical protein